MSHSSPTKFGTSWVPPLSNTGSLDGLNLCRSCLHNHDHSCGTVYIFKEELILENLSCVLCRPPTEWDAWPTGPRAWCLHSWEIHVGIWRAEKIKKDKLVKETSVFFFAWLPRAKNSVSTVCKTTEWKVCRMAWLRKGTVATPMSALCKLMFLYHDTLSPMCSGTVYSPFSCLAALPLFAFSLKSLKFLRYLITSRP